jgi:ubiquitin C-terminal hydrolase
MQKLIDSKIKLDRYVDIINTKYPGYMELNNIPNDKDLIFFNISDRKIINRFTDIYNQKLYNLYEVDVPHGIRNLHNTCYFNSVIQFLYRIVEMRVFLTDDRIKEQYKVGSKIHGLINIFNLIQTNGMGKYEQKHFFETCTLPNAQIDVQEDASEFLTAILTKLFIDCHTVEANFKNDNDLNTIKNISYYCDKYNSIPIRTFPNNDPRNFLIFNIETTETKYFFGEVRQVMKQQTNTMLQLRLSKSDTLISVQKLMINNSTSTSTLKLEYKDITDIDTLLNNLIKIGAIKKEENNGQIEVYDGIYNNPEMTNVEYLRTEPAKVGYYNNLGDYFKQYNTNPENHPRIIYIVSESINIVFNNYIIVNLVIFDETQAKIYYRGDLHIDTHLVLPSGEQYECISVVVHSGSTIRYGHYYTYAKYNNEWYELNDSSVSKVDQYWYRRNIQTNPKSTLTPYIVLYRKVNKLVHAPHVPHVPFETVSDNRVTNNLDNYLV